MPLHDAAILTSIRTIGAALVIVISGWLLDRINRCHILAVRLALLTAATSILGGLFACLLVSHRGFSSFGQRG